MHAGLHCSERLERDCATDEASGLMPHGPPSRVETCEPIQGPLALPMVPRILVASLHCTTGFRGRGLLMIICLQPVAAKSACLHNTYTPWSLRALAPDLCARLGTRRVCTVTEHAPATRRPLLAPGSQGEGNPRPRRYRTARCAWLKPG